ncbi:hypothetical protein PISMIDRAFT_679408 [Pisolithus microcarpus 441]|uniref:Uncharacterized protein n=1 Tax=Pisolithus microcarpus 441 TaxID=765257 RepID=A0A0C9YEZ5_9AGAM|nr:hypothetical protein PISMIDRAFT_679408 [Pisolithus microcarpus 441]
MNSRRNRTISGASLDACDGNTATNTVVESPAQSTVGPAPFPPLSPPPIRDPMLATTEWRDREEAERREQKRGKILRPVRGVRSSFVASLDVLERVSADDILVLYLLLWLDQCRERSE